MAEGSAQRKPHPMWPPSSKAECASLVTRYGASLNALALAVYEPQWRVMAVLREFGYEEAPTPPVPLPSPVGIREALRGRKYEDHPLARKRCPHSLHTRCRC